MPDPNDMKELKALAAQMAAIRARVQAEGGFLHDRELHQCPACGLMEDVLFSGKLVTYWNQTTEPVDTGLRFSEVGADQLACTCCGGVAYGVACLAPSLAASYFNPPFNRNLKPKKS